MKSTLDQKGFEIIENLYSNDEIYEILERINAKSFKNQFGLREFLTNYPDISDLVFSKKLMKVLESTSLSCNKSIKSIYFDKPPSANWIVNWHQDLTINLKNRKGVSGFKNWRTTSKRTIVQPTREILENIFTIRIHLDDCTAKNGALRIIEGSHKQGVIDIKKWNENKIGVEKICEIKKGGILILKPLTLHSSKRSEIQRNRRVIHIEFTEQELPNELQWKEKISLAKYR